MQDFTDEYLDQIEAEASSPLDGIPFGVGPDGAPMDVDEVPRGLACGCTCPACSTKLVARQGEIRIHHFAHQSLTECRHAFEASLYAMILELLHRPGCKLYLPGFGYRSSILSRFCLGLDQELLQGVPLGEWIRPPKRVVLENVRVTGTAFSASTPTVPEVEFSVKGAVASIHLLTYRKTLSQVRAAAPRDRPVLVLNVRSYAAVWWRSCDPVRTERMKVAARAKDVLSSWLEGSSDGRGWLCRPDCESDLQNLIAWSEKRRALEREKRQRERAAEAARRLVQVPPQRQLPLPTGPVVRKPASFVGISAPAPERPPPPPDVPNEILIQNIGTCYCGQPLNRVLLGSGFFAGKEVEMCSANPRHPLKICVVTRAPDAR